jgi:hypothetical protein
MTDALCCVCGRIFFENPEAMRCQKCRRVFEGLLVLLAPRRLVYVEKPHALLSPTQLRGGVVLRPPFMYSEDFRTSIKYR